MTRLSDRIIGKQGAWLPLVVFLWNAAACAGPLSIDPETIDFGTQAKLATKLVESPHNYFRFVNEAFTNLVCERYAGDACVFPEVTLHGDAHVEQYAVMADGRGLTDYDATTTGPGIVDLLRFGTSLELAARERGWPGAGREALAAFLTAYDFALSDNAAQLPDPTFVDRIRKSFDQRHEDALAACELLMQPATVTVSFFEEHLAEYVRQIRAARPDLPPGYFTIKKVGDLTVGIGSALYQKHLLRLEGRTDDDDDDLFIEVKEAAGLPVGDCVRIDWPDDALRVLAGESKLAFSPGRLRGCLTLPDPEQPGRDRRFCVRRWELAWRGIDINEDLRTREELLELARDCGLQLGLGHPKVAPETKRPELRQRLVAALAVYDSILAKAPIELADLTIAAWEEFRAALHD